MTSSPHLTDEQLERTRKLLDLVRAELTKIANGDVKTLHHARRYVQKRLEMDERSTPADRNKLKLTLMAKQGARCAVCGEPLPSRGAELDRREPIIGYTEENCRLIHHECHREAQAAKNFS